MLLPCEPHSLYQYQNLERIQSLFRVKIDTHVTNSLLSMKILDSFSAKCPSMIIVLILQFHGIKLSTDLALIANAVPLTR